MATSKIYRPADVLENNFGGIHKKGWGHELWIVNNGRYCGKILHFNKGKMCSLHFHMVKDETMYLQSGHLQVRIIDQGEEIVQEMFPGDALHIHPGMIHQIGALEDSDLFEFSTTHHDTDSYRVEKGD
jgi:oxalate decarboxylase/phosphoglucose isomerase-like protein (cupin superfamily)